METPAQHIVSGRMSVLSSILSCARRTRVFRIVLRNLDVARKAELLQKPYAVVVRVELVPLQAVPCRNRMGMVVVVPAFAARQQCHPPVVTRFVAGWEAARSPHMCSGVDQPR